MSEYVKERILALRHEQPGALQNVACARTNAMRYLPNYFAKGQLHKMFFLFPDPHFKVCGPLQLLAPCSAVRNRDICSSGVGIVSHQYITHSKQQA